jgi:perosamine synthetase
MRPFLGDEEAAAAAEAVRSGWVAQGPRVREFEEAFRTLVGARHAVAVSSCTSALQLSLALCNLSPGREVVVPSSSFIATANCVAAQGLQPVFADVELTTGNVSAATVEAVLGPATGAVVVVHQTGIPADLDALHELCRARGVVVVEDAACALGATYKAAPVGAGSEYVAFSFHPRKVITTGEGGMLTLREATVAARARRLREHGMSTSAIDRHAAGAVVLESYDEPGFNFRMTDIQAAVGLVQLRRLDGIVARRREIAAIYQRELAPYVPLMASDPPYGTTNFQSFWILLAEDHAGTQHDVLEGLRERGVSARRGVMASHLEPAYRENAHGPLPNSEQIARRSVILPLFHTMTQADIEHVVESVAAVLQARA